MAIHASARCAGRISPDMSSLWARIEPLLARVQKPARYIGCEDGAIAPQQLESRARSGAVS